MNVKKKKLTDAIKSIYLGNIFKKFLWKKKKQLNFEWFFIFHMLMLKNALRQLLINHFRKVLIQFL